MEENRRKHIRVSYCYDAKIRSSDTDWEEVDVIDLSAGGLKFYIGNNIKIGEELWFKLEAPAADDEDDNPQVVVRGKIVRTEQSDSLFGCGVRYEYGVMFAEDRDTDGLTAILRTCVQ
ncbi:MAG: PilZ domain-containing protein [Oscillospiraceae bacterium]|jgi:c-di-GMP-binding flagellar brake protein YcgR|nr:PilZ domain-containing protein [Oscillospiraceae bacterium]